MDAVTTPDSVKASDFEIPKISCQWIGLRENLNRKPSIFPLNYIKLWNMGLSCKFSLKPIHWSWVHNHCDNLWQLRWQECAVLRLCCAGWQCSSGTWSGLLEKQNERNIEKPSSKLWEFWYFWGVLSIHLYTHGIPHFWISPPPPSDSSKGGIQVARDSAASKTIGAKPPKRQKPTWRNAARTATFLGRWNDEKV